VILLLALLVIPLSYSVSSCTQDAYEKGEGEYSLMRGDFAEAQVDGTRQIVSITTDDGDQMALSKPYTAKWIMKNDTIYRCMLYYNKVKKSQGEYEAEVLSLGEVPCPIVKPIEEFKKEVHTDPVKFESMWLSKSGKYLNFYFQIKTGVTEDTAAVQHLAFLSEKVVANPDGKLTNHLLLYHHQNGVPEYYSTKAYVSIPVAALAADSICLSVNTYNGPVAKRISIRK